ncbi:TPA: hypothetical protein U2M34_002867 [Providencia rettgeri]|nr:hypothetical protein [Providencia rettgeri]
MFKRLFIGIVFSITASTIANAGSGLYRDENFNLNSYQGDYECNIYPMPNDITNWSEYTETVIGRANVVVKNQKNGTGKYIFVDLNNGKKIDNVLLPLLEKGSSSTMYIEKYDDFLMTYALSAEGWSLIAIQDKRKGNELSVLLGGCKLLRNQEEPAPADPQ